MGGQFVWPKVSEVADYRKKVRQTMLDVIENTPLELPVTQDSKWVRWSLYTVTFSNKGIPFRQVFVLLYCTGKVS